MHTSGSQRSAAGTPGHIRLGMWIMALAIAGFQAIAYRNAMNPDGLSYLDSARALAAGDIAAGLSPHWGPLYPAAVAVAFRLLKPGIAGMIPVAHAVTFVFFIVALAAFDFFLRELLRDQELPVAGPALFGYAVFMYVAVALTGVRAVTPDFAVMAAVFAAAGLLVRMRRNGVTPKDAALLGLALALGYFGKSVMFVLGVVFIGSMLFLPAPASKRWRGMAIAGVVFFALASVLVIPFSRNVGKLTFGTAGKLAYNWEVNRLPYTNWQGDAHSHLEHPPHQVRSNPDVFEYRRHLEGTYPPWFDPAYWNAGAVTTFEPWKQLLQFHRSTDFYIELFFGSAGAVATLLALLTWRGTVRNYLPVLIPAVAGLAVYWPVHLEARYVAPFAGLLWIVPALAFRPDPDRARGLTRVMTAAAAVLLIPLLFRAVSDLWQRRDEPNPFPIVATELQHIGLAPGDGVANVGGVLGENFGSSFEGYWAYLAGLHIVAEIPERKDFICRDPALVNEVLDQLAATGARAVVTRAIPTTACTAGWRPIAGTDFYVRLLPTPTNAPPLPNPK